MLDRCWMCHLSTHPIKGDGGIGTKRLISLSKGTSIYKAREMGRASWFPGKSLGFISRLAETSFSQCQHGFSWRAPGLCVTLEIKAPSLSFLGFLPK